MIVNHFKMRSNVMTYNLSGMGCSAGVISIGLAQQLLQVRGVVAGAASAWPCSSRRASSPGARRAAGALRGACCLRLLWQADAATC